MAIRNVIKNYAGMEDLLTGVVGTTEQVRNGVSYTLGNVDVPYAVDSTAKLQALDVTLYINARVYSSATAFVDYRYDPADVTGIAPVAGSGSWLSVSTASVQYVAKFADLSAAASSVFKTISYADGWAATVAGPIGGGTYDIATKAVHDIVRATSTVDELGDHTLANGNVALLRHASGVRQAAQFGARDGLVSSFEAIDGAIRSLLEGGEVYLPAGDLNIGLNTIRDDVLTITKVGKTITLIGVGATEAQVASGKVTTIHTTGGTTGISFNGNRSGGRNFAIKGDNGSQATSVANIVVESSRAQWRNIVSAESRGSGFKFRFGNGSHFEAITCLDNNYHGFDADGTGYIYPDDSSSRPNDLNACTFVNIDVRANANIGFRTGINSGFANNCYQITTQGNGGHGMEFNGNFWNVYGFYGEANDAAGTGKDIVFSSTADVNTVYGQFSNVAPAWEDLSSNQRNYIEQYKTFSSLFGTDEITIGENDTPAGRLVLSGEGDGTNRTLTLEGTSGSQTLEILSSGAGTFKLDPQDGIVLEASTAPTLLNSWVDFGGSRKVAGFYKDATGVVHLEGVIKSGATANPTQLFLLPVGYRPAGGRVYFVTTSNGAFASGFVEITGEVYIETGSNVSYSLDSISFRTD